MANTIATVAFLDGQAWAKALNGSVRPLKVGDSVTPEEVVVTAKDGRIELDFGDGHPVAIAGGQQVAMSPDLWTDLAADNKDAALQDASVEEALTLLNNGGDLTNNLEATAAGLTGGGADEGHSFVQLTRVVESTTGESFNFVVNAAVAPIAIAESTPAPAPTVDSVPETTPAVISAGSGTVKEDVTTSTGGQLQIIDPDLGEAVFLPQPGTPGNYGTFTLDANGNWTYVLNNDSQAVQGLAEGATLPSEVFEVTSIDGTKQTVTVAISGTNDIASIIPEPTMSIPGPGAPLPHNDEGSVKEDVILTSSGRLLVSDADFGQAIFQVQHSVAGAHGSFSIDADGHWTYQLNNLDPAVQALREGETLPPEIFTVLSSDGSASHNITITITGTNDAAIISTAAGAGSDAGAVKEDVVLSTGGQLTVADVDNGQAFFQVQNNVPGAHGSFSIDANGNWSYQLNNADPAVQALAEGARLPNEIFAVKSIDGATHNITVTISGTNDTAVITTAVGSTDTGLVKEDAILTAGGKLNVTDLDTGEAIFQAQANVPAAHGSFSIDVNGNWSYLLNNADPAVQALGEGQTLAKELFTVSSVDGTTHVVTVVISGTNDAPVAVADIGFGAVENTALTLTAKQLLANDSDLDSDTLSIASVQAAAHGTVALDNVGNVVFTPDNHYNGPTSFTYTISDGNGGSSTASVSLTVKASNDAPLTANQNLTTSEDTPITGKVVASDVDGDTLSYSISTSATHGTVSITSATGDFTYSPAANYNGQDSFVVTVTDGFGGTATSVITVGITPVNDAPLAVNDSVTTAEDTTLVLASSALLGNDSDSDGDTITIKSVQDPTHGTVALVNGDVVFTPTANYHGPASFTYTLQDPSGASSTATVSVNVTPVNHAPVAVNDPGDTVITKVGLQAEYYSYYEGPNGGNLGNIDQAKTFIANHGPDATFIATRFDYGNAALFENNLGYGTNLQRFLGDDAASLSNDPGDSSDAIIRMSGAIELAAGTYNFRVYGDDGYEIKIDGNVVAEVNQNQAPNTTVHPNFTIATDGVHEVEILYWDQGYQAVFTVEISADGGSTYTILDSTTTTHVAAHLMSEDTTWTVAATELLANDTDADNNSLSIISVQDAVNGTVHLNIDKTVSFTPDANFSGSASYSYTVSDGNGGTDTARVNISVLSINDSPLANKDILIAAKNTGAEGSNAFATTIPQSDLLLNDTDIDGNKLSITHVGSPENGYVWMANGDVMFLPFIGFTGIAHFDYTISDNHGGSSIITTDVMVASINGDEANNTLNGTESSDTIVGLGGDDTINGIGGNDFIDGSAGNDHLLGGAGNDLLKGGAGNDVVEGGTGNDHLAGGTGVDTFVWHLTDKGTTLAPAVDTVIDFTPGANGDKLDIKDLLQNENSGNLTNYLHFASNGTDTTISISSSGEFDGSNYSTSTDQTIVLAGVSLTGTDTDIIHQLKNNGNLITD